jgi:hypothetical protein
MKQILFLTGLLFAGCFCRAQRFFYIEDSRATEKVLTEDLKQALQYVTPSPLSSDYIIKSDVGYQPETHSLTLQITVQDSVSFQTIFQSSEIYDFRKSNSDQRIFLSMAVSTFLEKNIQQILLCAKDDHYNLEMKGLRPRKDKT